MNDLRDAKRALGFGVTFLAYAAWLAFDYFATKRRLRELTRAKLIHDGAHEKRAELMRQEGLTDASVD